MFIKIGGSEYELRTTLGVVKALETRSKKTLSELMAEFAKGASVDDMLATLKAGAGTETAKALEQDILENCDLVTIQRMCDEFFIRLCFGGTPEEQEEKIEAFPASPRRRNLMRRALGLPEKEIPSTSGASSGQDTVSA